MLLQVQDFAHPLVGLHEIPVSVFLQPVIVSLMSAWPSGVSSTSLSFVSYRISVESETSLLIMNVNEISYMYKDKSLIVYFFLNYYLVLKFTLKIFWGSASTVLWKNIVS